MKDDYECPRCGYRTHFKSSMRNHLFKKQKACPGTRETIELTDEIKQHILDNKIYKVIHQPTNTQVVNNYINNYNTVNNFVSNLDFMNKLTKYMTYNNLELIDYGDKVKEQYSRTIHRLERNMIKDYKLTINEFMEILDNVSSLCNGDYEQYNIHFDDKTKKLKLYEDGEWSTFLQEPGLSKVVAGIQEHFLDVYELYLVKKLYNEDISIVHKNEVKEYLTEYYYFLACFNLHPYVKDKTNKYILNGDVCDDGLSYQDYTISEHLMEIYKTQVEKQQQIRVRKDVCEIIKRNSKQNLDDLNKKIAALFNIDATFKEQILSL